MYVDNLTNSQISRHTMPLTKDAQFNGVTGEHRKPASIFIDREAASMGDEE